MRSRRVRAGETTQPAQIGGNVTAYDVVVSPMVWECIIDAIRDSNVPELPDGFARVDRMTGEIIIRIAGHGEKTPCSS